MVGLFLVLRYLTAADRTLSKHLNIRDHDKSKIGVAQFSVPFPR